MYTFSSNYNWIGRLNMTQFSFYIVQVFFTIFFFVVGIISLIQFTHTATLGSFVDQLRRFVETD